MMLIAKQERFQPACSGICGSNQTIPVDLTKACKKTGNLGIDLINTHLFG